MITRRLITLSNLKSLSLLQSNGVCATYLNSIRWKADDRRELIESTPKKDSGTQGERSMDLDLISQNKEDMFPDHTTPNRLFNGIRFDDIPICHIKTSPNNTIMQVVKAHSDKLYAYRSCGLEGFKNTRKGTNIAAQATAITVANMLKEKGVSQVRVQIQGLGPGRISSVKGLQMGGIQIISVTDTTPISFHPPRPKKQRRL